MIDKEIESGIPPEKIIVSGFSQGAVMTLTAGLSYPKKLGGIIAMSGYMPMPEKFPSLIHESNRKTPILMFHGKEDEVLKYEWGHQSYEKLKELGCNIKFTSFDFMGHSACDDEIMLILDFVKKIACGKSHEDL